MILYSIDLETTGLDPDTCGVLEMGVVRDDLSLPWRERSEWSAFIDPGECSWEDGARELHMKSGLYDEWMAAASGLRCRHLVHSFHLMLSELKTPEEGKIILAGKNFWAFDALFFPKGFLRAQGCRHRSLDPGSMWATPDDEQPPGLDECLQRAGLAGSVTHRAVDDARDVCRVIRAHYGLDVF
jgi:oligoribonuclease (3'-5' exoribonuclease)